MPAEVFEDDEIYRFDQVAYDVGLLYGSTTPQALARCRRALNHAMIDLAGHNRRWSWLTVKDSFRTASGVREYSLQPDVKTISYLWMEGTNRQLLGKLPTGQFIERVPNPNTTSGVPRLWDEQGVDSSGCKVLTLYPVPSGVYEIFLRYTRHIKPIREGEKDVRQAWGLPQNLLLPLHYKAAAIAKRGISAESADALELTADAKILEAYAADQEDLPATFRAPMMGEVSTDFDGPMLPPEFGWG